MTICPNCNKAIKITVSGKYTCSCGEVIQISTPYNNPLHDQTKVESLKQSFRNYNESIGIGLFIIVLISFFAWDLDLPNLFGQYSSIAWQIVSYILLLFYSLILIVVLSVVYSTIKEKQLTFKKVGTTIFYISILLILIFQISNDIGLTNIDLNLGKYLKF